jgi:hypothetical protein
MAKLPKHSIVLGKITYKKPHNQEEILEKVANLILYGSTSGRVPFVPSASPTDGAEGIQNGRVYGRND